MKKLTPDTVVAYIKNGGTYCPFCKKDELQFDSTEVNEGVTTQGVLCLSCGQSWEDVSNIVGLYHEPEGRTIYKDEAQAKTEETSIDPMSAAAPEMFDALEAVLEWAIIKERGSTYVANMRKPVAFEKLRAALDKAKPGTSPAARIFERILAQI